MRTLNLDEAAAFLHMHPEEVRTRAKRGLIPGAKTGRCWVFLEIDLAEFVRSLYPVRRQALQVTTSQEGVCHLSSARSRRFGGSTSSRRMAREYDDLLKPPTAKRPRSSTTS
ncbi:MAG: helix-turn-helix domain-containing protein [Candidatus Dormibacteria bacterium]